MEGAKAQLPKELSWIPDLVHGAFFAPCDVHSTGSKGEQVNLFSLSSRRSMCPACAAERDVFDTIQIRRSSYHNVVRVQDVCKLMDVTGIQTYIINSARVVFLNERPHPRSTNKKDGEKLMNHSSSSGRGAGSGERYRAGAGAQAQMHSECSYCARILQSDNNKYCSISCKMNGGEDMSAKGGIDMSYAEETIKPTPRKSTQAKNAAKAEKANSDRRSPARNKSPASDTSTKRARGYSPVSVKSEDEYSPSSEGATPMRAVAAATTGKRKYSSKDRNGDAPVTPTLLIVTPAVPHRRKSKPKKSPH